MILINKGETNEVVLTLTEKTTLTNPEYLFSFENDSTRDFKYFIAQDISEFPERFNKFLIEESSTEDLLNGKVQLEPNGFWTYVIYEQESSTNLNPALATGIVEKGKVKVIGEAPVKVVYKPEKKTKKVYVK